MLVGNDVHHSKPEGGQKGGQGHLGSYTNAWEEGGKQDLEICEIREKR